MVKRRRSEEKQHAADKQYGEHDSHQDIQQVDTPRDDNAGDDGEHQQSQYVIHYRRTEDDMRLAGLFTVQVL